MLCHSGLMIEQSHRIVSMTIHFSVTRISVHAFVFESIEIAFSYRRLSHHSPRESKSTMGTLSLVSFPSIPYTLPLLDLCLLFRICPCKCTTICSLRRLRGRKSCSSTHTAKKVRKEGYFGHANCFCPLILFRQVH